MANESGNKTEWHDYPEGVHPCEAGYKPGRREFLRSAGSASAGAAAVAASGCGSAATEAASAPGPADDMPDAKPGPLLPTVSFGRYKITRLISGANPIYGYSHFNRLYSAHMREYHTHERVVAYFERLERAGINAFQTSWSERGETDWNRYKDAGGKLQLLLLSKPWFHEQPELLERAVKAYHPMGAAQHGGRTRQLWYEGKMDESVEYLKRIRGLGLMVGLSVHRPEEIEYSEDKGWDVDYYMTGLYEMNRPKSELEKMLGQQPIGEVYLPSDPPRMLKTIRQVSKPCLAYKALAAGRLTSSPEQIREQLEMVYRGLKPSDALILGMYQRYEDQIGQNAGAVRGILST